MQQDSFSSLPSEPRRFFRHGPSPIARLTFFGVISLALMFIDARFQTLETLRMAVATVVYPIQQTALLPGEIRDGISSFFESRDKLRRENAQLKTKLLTAAQAQQAYIASQQERERLEKLLALSQHTPNGPMAARVVYIGRDPFSQKAFISRSASQDYESGSAVIDEQGLLGQLTRVHPLFAELTLLTDKDFTVPVKIERTSMRALLYGRGSGKPPELRYVANSANVQVGDVLLTSGIEGIYPANLRVGEIVTVDRNAESTFAHIYASPSANINGVNVVLVLNKSPETILPPVGNASSTGTTKGRSR